MTAQNLLLYYARKSLLHTQPLVKGLTIQVIPNCTPSFCVTKDSSGVVQLLWCVHPQTREATQHVAVLDFAAVLKHVA